MMMMMMMMMMMWECTWNDDDKGWYFAYIYRYIIYRGIVWNAMVSLYRQNPWPRVLHPNRFFNYLFSLFYMWFAVFCHVFGFVQRKINPKWVSSWPTAEFHGPALKWYMDDTVSWISLPSCEMNSAPVAPPPVSPGLHPGKLTWNLKKASWKSKKHLQTTSNHQFSGFMLIFGGVLFFFCLFLSSTTSNILFHLKSWQALCTLEDIGWGTFGWGFKSMKNDRKWPLWHDSHMFCWEVLQVLTPKETITTKRQKNTNPSTKQNPKSSQLTGLSPLFWIIQLIEKILHQLIW